MRPLVSENTEFHSDPAKHTSIETMLRTLKARLANGRVVHIQVSGTSPASPKTRAQLAKLLTSPDIREMERVEYLENVVTTLFPGLRAENPVVQDPLPGAMVRPDLTLRLADNSGVSIVEAKTLHSNGDGAQEQVERHVRDAIHLGLNIREAYVIYGRSPRLKKDTLINVLGTEVPLRWLTWDDVVKRIAADTSAEDEYTILLVEIVGASRRLLKLLVDRPDLLTGVDDRRFEESLATMLHDLGIEEIELTPARKDGGRDIIARRKHPTTGVIETYLFECKHWTSGKKVNVKVATTLLAVSEAENATGAFLVSSSGFGPRLVEQEATLEKKGLRLRDSTHVHRWISAWARYYGSPLVSPLDPLSLI